MYKTLELKNIVFRCIKQETYCVDKNNTKFLYVCKLLKWMWGNKKINSQFKLPT